MEPENFEAEKEIELKAVKCYVTVRWQHPTPVGYTIFQTQTKAKPEELDNWQTQSCFLSKNVSFQASLLCTCRSCWISNYGLTKYDSGILEKEPWKDAAFTLSVKGVGM